jgi:hypothetical protein
LRHAGRDSDVSPRPLGLRAKYTGLGARRAPRTGYARGAARGQPKASRGRRPRVRRSRLGSSTSTPLFRERFDGVVVVVVEVDDLIAVAVRPGSSPMRLRSMSICLGAIGRHRHWPRVRGRVGLWWLRQHDVVRHPSGACICSLGAGPPGYPNGCSAADLGVDEVFCTWSTEGCAGSAWSCNTSNTGCTCTNGGTTSVTPCIPPEDTATCCVSAGRESAAAAYSCVGRLRVEPHRLRHFAAPRDTGTS